MRNFRSLLAGAAALALGSLVDILPMHTRMSRSIISYAGKDFHIGKEPLYTTDSRQVKRQKLRYQYRKDRHRSERLYPMRQYVKDRYY